MPGNAHRRLASRLRWVVLSGSLFVACDDDDAGTSAEELGQRGQITATSNAPTTPTATPSQQNAPRTTPHETAQVSEGNALYQKYCALCHGVTGTGYKADNAPSLVSKTFLESASDQFLRRGIRMGRPNTAMAAYGKVRGGPLTEEEIGKIVAFLRARGPKYERLPAYDPKGDPERGKRLFQVECQKCHGDENQRGNAVSLHNPELLVSSSPAFLKHAIENGRPPTPMLPFRDKLTDSQIDDIVVWLKGLSPNEPASPPVRRPTVPEDLPMIVNPDGKAPAFTLREDRFVSAAQVEKALKQKRRMVLIDARSPADWIQFRIPGSVPIAYYETERLSKVPNDGTWVVAYCACPHHASGLVVDALRRKGFKHTAVLDEGILVWRKRGYPLEGEAVDAKDSSKPAPSATTR